MVRRLILFFIITFIPQIAFANYAEFNGTTSYATAPTATNMSTVPLEFYIEVKPTALSSTLGHNQVLFTKLNSTGATYELTIDSADDKIHFRTNVGGSGGVNIVDNTAITANQRYSILVYIDGSLGCSMYINSVTAEASTGTSAALNTTGASDLSFGGRGSGDRNFQGNIYMFRINSIDISSIHVDSAIIGALQLNGMLYEYSFFDGEGSLLRETWSANDGQVFNVTWHINTYNYVIPEEHNDKYMPIEMTGTMWDNMGLSRETEPYAHGDWSWNYDTKCEEPQYTKYWLSPTGNDTTGDGSYGNPWATFLPLWNQYGGIGEYGDCIILKPGTYRNMNAGVSVHNYITNPGSNSNKIIVTGSGEGESIIRFDNTADLVWSAVDSNIYKADWAEDMTNWYYTPANVVMDDNWPYGTRRVWTYADLQRDGDWFWDDLKTGTSTSASTGKIIDSTANFGSETPNPTQVGDVIYVPSLSNGNFKTRIRSIDSTTQLGVDDSVPSGVAYKILGDLYIHTSGRNPLNRSLVIPLNSGDTDAYGFNHGGAEYMEYYGLTLVGAGTYAMGGFTTVPTGHITIDNILAKYNGKGTAVVGTYSTMDRVVSFGNGIRSHGNGSYGNGQITGGWPAVTGCRSGCIVAWSFGEGVGGQANPTTGYGDTRVVEDSIIINSWSVNLYAFDTTKTYTARNNIIFNHQFRPSWTIPDSEIASRGTSRGAIYRRMMPYGLLTGDEIAAPGQTKGRLGYGNIYNNIFVDTKGCMDVFKEIPLNVGLDHVDFVHNICITPSQDGSVMGAGWSLFEFDKVVGDLSNDSSRIYNNIFIGPSPNAFFSLFSSAETNTALSGVHSDYNYFFVENPRAFNWKLVNYATFEDYRTASGQDEHSVLGTITSEGVISPAVIGRSDWDADTITMTIDDFTPTADSVLINTGTLLMNSGGTQDRDFLLDIGGKLRPLHGLPDIGPIEYGTWYPRNINNGDINGGSF